MTSYNKRDHPTVRRGSRGDPVVRLQQRLVKHNKSLDETRFVDGVFGPGTEREVRDFQKKKSLSVDGVVGRNTWTALLQDPAEKIASPVGGTANTTDRNQARDEANPRTSGGSALADKVMRALKRKGYTFNDDGKSYHLNIVGVRNPSTAINNFDDRVILVYRDDNGQMQANEYPITTDPGEYYTKQKLLNKAGAAILVPGQYNSYKLGKHRGAYEALTQSAGEVTVWRDGNKDDKLDRTGQKHSGWFGINIHRAGQSGTTSRVGKYSAGCQVFANADNFATLIGLAKKSVGIRGNHFTYTLLDEADLK